MSYFYLLINNLIKKGNKSKALKTTFSIVKHIKKKTKKSPFLLFNKIIKTLNLNIETTPVTYFGGKNLKKRVRFSKINGERINRFVFKFFLNSVKNRIEISLQNKIINEFRDFSDNLYALSFKRKKQLLVEILKFRPSAVIMNNKRKRKKINKL